MPKTIVNGIQLYYEVEGSGPPFVLLHPDTLDLSVWDKQVPFFSRYYKVIRYDARGHGRSDSPESWYTGAVHVEDLFQLLRQLGIESCYLMGLSGGGSRAIKFTLTHQYLVKALLLVDSLVSGYRMKSTLGKYAEIARTEGVKKALSEWFDVGSLSHVRPELKDAVKELLLSHSGAPLIDPLFGKYREEPDIGRLANILAPTLVMAGENDLQDFVDMADAIHKGIRRSEKIIVENAGHVPNMEQTDFFNRTVLNFLRNVERIKRGRLS